MEIKIAKFNTKDYEINIEGYDEEIGKIIFVVEDCLKNVVLKKELGNGIEKTGDNQYLLSIEANDTKKMNAMYSYKYFLEVIIENPSYVETTLTGDFILEESSSDLGDEING